MFKFFLLVSFLFLGQGTLFAENALVAIVNNDVITSKDLEDFTNFMAVQYRAQYSGEELQKKLSGMRKDLLDKLIEDRLILQEAKKAKIEVNQARVDARINEVKKHYGTDADFQRALAEQGLSQSDVETHIREQMLMYQLVESKIKSKVLVKPTEVTQFYADNIKEFIIPEQGQFDTVSSDDNKVITDIYAAVKTGKTLEEAAAAKGLSLSPLSAAKGEQLKKEVEDAVFSLKKGQSSRPVKIANKFYIFRLNSFSEPKQQTLEEVQERITLYLSEKKMQELLIKFLDELKSKSYIKIFTQD